MCNPVSRESSWRIAEIFVTVAVHNEELQSCCFGLRHHASLRSWPPRSHGGGRTSTPSPVARQRFLAGKNPKGWTLSAKHGYFAICRDKIIRPGPRRIRAVIHQQPAVFAAFIQRHIHK